MGLKYEPASEPQLLTPSEMARIQQIGVGRDAFHELTCWSPPNPTPYRGTSLIRNCPPL